MFTLPHHLSPRVLQNKKLLYDLLFRARAETLLEVAADPKHLGAEIGFLSVLPSWGQNLLHHPHVHGLIPAGGLSPDGLGWVHTRDHFFLPVTVLRRVFRGKFVDGLRRRFRQRQLTFVGTLQPLANEKAFPAFLPPRFRQNWVVYAKPPFAGPRHVLGYLARYTHRVAITNQRLVDFEGERVTFRWKDYAHGNKKRMMTLSAAEFLRRFLLHVLPRGFVRIPSFGFLANCRRAQLLPLGQPLLQDDPQPQCSVAVASTAKPAVFRCPHCATAMIVGQKLSALTLWQLTLTRPRLDSSSPSYIPTSTAAASAPTALVSLPTATNRNHALRLRKNFCLIVPHLRQQLQPSSLIPALKLHPKRTNYETPFQTP